MQHALPNSSEPCIYVADLRAQQHRYPEAFRLLERVVPNLTADPVTADYVRMLLQRLANQGKLPDEVAQLGRQASPAVRALPAWAPLLASPLGNG